MTTMRVVGCCAISDGYKGRSRLRVVKRLSKRAMNSPNATQETKLKGQTLLDEWGQAEERQREGQRAFQRERERED